MNRKQRATYEAIFAEPVRANIVWKDLVSLIKGLGGEVVYNDGSKVFFCLNELVFHLHSPHPQKEIKKYLVKELRDFLRDAIQKEEI